MLRKSLKLTLSLIGVILFSTGYWICKSTYPGAFGENFNQDSVNRFTDLRYSIYAAIMLIILVRSSIIGDSFKFDVYVTSVGIGLSVADVIDRYKYDITQFTKEDMAMIIATLIISYIEVYTDHGLKSLINKISNRNEKDKFKLRYK